MITQKQIEYVHEMHVKHAKLNGREESDVEILLSVDGRKMYWRAPHFVTGAMVGGVVPPSVYMHIDAEL